MKLIAIYFTCKCAINPIFVARLREFIFQFIETMSNANSSAGSRGRGGSRRNGRRRDSGADPSQGWKLDRDQSSTTLHLQDFFIDDIVSERACKYSSVVVERLQTELAAHQLAETRAGHVVLFSNELLEMCKRFLNAKEALSQSPRRFTTAQMYQYFAVLLYSHCTGFSPKKTIDKLRAEGCHVPTLDTWRQISQNILAFSPTNRGDLGQNSWNAQRDRTILLDRFETTAFEMSRNVFFVSDYSILTLDDDLYGTRSSDNQVKTLSARKADKEGHCAIAVADALFRSTIGIRFMRRGENQDACVQKVLERILDETGQINVNGVVMAADRGFGKISAIRKMASLGINILFIFPEHRLKCHPFVGASFLDPKTRESESEREDDDDDEEENSESGDEDSTGPRRRTPR